VVKGAETVGFYRNLEVAGGKGSSQKRQSQRAT
jgi:hypothetical protein